MRQGRSFMGEEQQEIVPAIKQSCAGIGYISSGVISQGTPSSPVPVIQMPAVAAPLVSLAPVGLDDGWLLMKGAAAKMRRSYHWFSRRWRKMGLRPSAGRPLLFREEEIEAYLQRHRVRPRGRPRIA